MDYNWGYAYDNGYVALGRRPRCVQTTVCCYLWEDESVRQSVVYENNSVG
jgi:hypothetical protein